MPVPYFSKDKPFNIYQKINSIFLVKKIWKIDFFLLIVFIGLVIFQFIVNICFRGKNDFLFLLQPFNSIVSGDVKWADWLKPYNVIYFLIITSFFCYRMFLAFKFFKKLNMFNSKSRNDDPFCKPSFKFLIFLPWASFSIYPIMEKLSQFEVFDKYNL